MDVDFDFYGVHAEAGVGFVDKLGVHDGHGKLKGPGSNLEREAGLHFIGGKLDGALNAANAASVGPGGIGDAADENAELVCCGA